MVGERIKSVRKRNGLTLKAFADALSTSPGFVSEIENGIKLPGFDLLHALKKVFNVDLNWVIDGEGLTPEKFPSAYVQKTVRLMEDMKEKDQKDAYQIIKDNKDTAEIKEAYERLKHLDQKALKHAGLISLNLLHILALPPMMILCLVGIKLIDGKLGVSLLSNLHLLYIPLGVSLIISYRRWLNILTSRYVSFFNFNRISR